MTQMQDVFSSDGSLRAQVMCRPDGMYQVELFQRQVFDAPDAGNALAWVQLPGLTLLESLDEALVFAARHLGLERDDFDDE